MDRHITELEAAVNEIRDALRRREEPAGHKNVNTIRVEGAGSIWNGIAIGIALGAVVACTGWVATTLNRQSVITQQAEAYQKAVYMLAPRFAEEIDKELERHKEQK